MTRHRALKRRYGRAQVKQAQYMAGAYTVHVDANELLCDGGKLLPYGTTVGIINKRGTINVWMPAAHTPRGYKPAAKRLLEDERDKLRAQGLVK